MSPEAFSARVDQLQPHGEVAKSGLVRIAATPHGGTVSLRLNYPKIREKSGQRVIQLRAPKPFFLRSPCMSNASEDRYSPGLEGVIANETAIANVEGKEGAGGLEYRGYPIEDLAGAASSRPPSCSSTATCRRRKLRRFDARLRAAPCHPRAADRAVPQDPDDRSPDGRAADLGQRPARISTPRSTPPRATTPPTSARPSG